MAEVSAPIETNIETHKKLKCNRCSKKSANCVPCDWCHKSFHESCLSIHIEAVHRKCNKSARQTFSTDGEESESDQILGKNSKSITLESLLECYITLNQQNIALINAMELQRLQIVELTNTVKALCSEKVINNTSWNATHPKPICSQGHAKNVTKNSQQYNMMAKLDELGNVRTNSEVTQAEAIEDSIAPCVTTKTYSQSSTNSDIVKNTLGTQLESQPRQQALPKNQVSTQRKSKQIIIGSARNQNAHSLKIIKKRAHLYVFALHSKQL